MLIAQITDIHLGFEPENPFELNRRRLHRTLGALLALDPAPDLLLVTGDLTDLGDVGAYRHLRRALRKAPFPVHLGLGNHDRRAGFLEVFPETGTADGFVQYAIEAGPVRILMLDTLEEGRQGGAFCETRARWLDQRLGEAPDRPTILVLHHPPVATGIEWMSAGPREAWVERLTAVVARHDHVVAALAGHIHRPIVTGWAGTLLAVCPSVAPQVALDLGPMQDPDDRPMIVEAPPGFALHLWTGAALVSHFAQVENHRVLARYTAAMQPFLDQLTAEREA